MHYKIRICLSVLALTSFLISSSLSAEENVLKGACAFNALTEDHIRGLDDWNQKQEILIGVETHQQGLIFQNHSDFSREESLEYLADIAFDSTEEFSSRKELIAEREPLRLNQTKVEVNQLPRL